MVPLFPTRSWPWVQTPVPPLCYSACLGALGAWVLAHSCVKTSKVKNPPKITFEKFVKLTDHTCACNNLTSSEYDVHGMTGNGSYLIIQKLAWKNLWNHFKLTYFWRVLAVWNHCAPPPAPRRHFTTRTNFSSKYTITRYTEHIAWI